MNLTINQATQIFTGSLIKGYKYLIVVNRRKDGQLDVDGIVTDLPNGEATVSLSRDYPSNFYGSGVARAMKRRLWLLHKESLA